MLSPGAHKPTSLMFIAFIFAAVIVDAFLLADVRAQYLNNHGYEFLPSRPAIAKPAPP
jgi:hypothetical protein